MRLPVLAILVALAAPVPETHRADIERWRAQREARLRAEGGWLSVVGLSWLREGPNRFGTAADNDVVLPEGSAAPHAGSFVLSEGAVTVELTAPGALVAGQPVERTVLRPDTSETPDVLSLPPRLTLHVIERGGRLGIRVKDSEAPARRHFAGLSWYDVDPAWRIEAQFVAYDPPRSLRVPDVLGDVKESPCPGYARFEIDGKEQRLEPVAEPDADELFFIFRDATSAHGTYGAGRFLYAERPQGGRVILDFNKAYSPPCAFTAFATCPLPPEGNRLGVAIEAGEKFAGH
jgi:uncharacterized protein (DUF1684 family)